MRRCLSHVRCCAGNGKTARPVSYTHLYQNDMDVLETLKREHEELERIKAGLKTKKAELAQQKQEMADEKVKLDAKKKELEKQEDELQAEADRLTTEIVKLMDKSSPYVGGTFTWPCPSSHYITCLLYTSTENTECCEGKTKAPRGVFAHAPRGILEGVFHGNR